VRDAAGGEDVAARAARVFGYTAENNPFGDANLTTSFVWKKKIEKDIASGAAQGVPSREEEDRRRDELMDEVERAKERRARREAERDEMDRLRAEETRLKEAAHYKEWEARDDEFHLYQARQKAVIRLREGRGTLSDTLFFNLLLSDTVTGTRAAGQTKAVLRDAFLRAGASTADPVELVRGAEGDVLNELGEDLRGLGELEAAAVEALASGGGGGSGGGGVRAGGRRTVGGVGTVPQMTTFPDFWAALGSVVEGETSRAAARAAGVASGRAVSALRAVEDEVDAMFEGKVERDLGDMEGEIRDMLAGRVAVVPSSLSIGAAATQGGAVDHEYWAGVLRHLALATARAALRRLHEAALLDRLEQIDVANAQWTAGEGGERMRARASVSAAPAAALDAAARASALVGADVLGGGGAGAGAAPAALLSSDAAGAASRRALIEARIAALHSRGAGTMVDGAPRVGWGGGEGEEAPLADAAGRPLPTGDGEEDLDAGAEVVVAGGGAGPVRLPAHLSAEEAALLSDKYKPRKPRYLNRVKTGYDWNQYNKTHYDKENPPPKTVQGYKFTVFYPDLLDRSRTPRFSLSPSDSPDYVIIRFTGGPPYEDIAFKIVNREWEYSRKNGFKCVFDRGVLHLWWNFKRMRYRK